MIRIDNIDQLHALGVELQQRAEDAAIAISTKDKTIPLGASVAQMASGHIVIGGSPNDHPLTQGPVTTIDPEGEVRP